MDENLNQLVHSRSALCQTSTAGRRPSQHVHPRIL